MSIPPLIAYTDRWSVRAGGSIEVKVSCSSANYRADLVRIRSADPNPAGPGMFYDDVPAAFELTASSARDDDRQIRVIVDVGVAHAAAI